MNPHVLWWPGPLYALFPEALTEGGALAMLAELWIQAPLVVPAFARGPVSPCAAEAQHESDRNSSRKHPTW